MHGEPNNIASKSATHTTPAWYLSTIRTAIKDHNRAQRRDADEAFVERVNDRVDRALELPISTLPEAEALLRLTLASEGEGMDDAALTPLRTIAAVLANDVVRRAKIDREVL